MSLLSVVILFTERSPEVEDIVKRALNDTVVAKRLTWVIPDAWPSGIFQRAHGKTILQWQK